MSFLNISIKINEIVQTLSGWNKHIKAIYITEQPVRAMTSLNILNLILNKCKLLLSPECNYTDLQPWKKRD